MSSIAVARRYLSAEHLDLVTRPTLMELMFGDLARTVIRFRVAAEALA